MIQRLCVIGVGLIGGSLIAALRERGLVREVVGCSRREETLGTAQYLGLIDRGETDPVQAIAGADMVVVAIPMGQYKALFEALRPVWPAEAIVTDCGSTKASVHADLQAVFGELPSNFVAGHPVAGTERSGPAAATPDLYRHRRVILTPHASADAGAVERVQAMWEGVGAAVSRMQDTHHDEILAMTSHLPHLIAYQLIGTLADAADEREVFAYAAGGLRDLTRIASSDAGMWRDIVLANREAVLSALDRYMADLTALRSELVEADSRGLHLRFAEARSVRETWIRTAEVD